jgi:pimeloyl-ACP methyl ester carboxylesterase
VAKKDIFYKNYLYSISYDIVNLNATKDIVFLHGWGSNKEVMKTAFGSYLQEMRHIYIDMPGFGNSTNEQVLTTADYEEIIKTFLNEIKSTPEVIVGHSFGGKVATLLNPKYLVLLSSAGILEEKPLDVKIKIALTKILGRLGLREFTKVFRTKDASNMPQNMYETLKNVVNEDFSTHFAEFKNTALIFWGTKDKATSLQSGKKISELIKDSNFHALNGDHYFFLQHAKFISEVIKSNVLD